jgi:hypothetical protein
MNAASIVTNGSFEQGPLGIGSFAGWQLNAGDSATFVDSSGKTGLSYGQAFDGLWAAYFGTGAANGGASITQTLPTVAGQVYQLTFHLANDNGGLAPVSSFRASVGGSAAVVLTNLGNQPFGTYGSSFVATSEQTALTFFGSNDNGYLELDAVAVEAVPEPGALSLLCAGGAALGLGLLRRMSRSRIRVWEQ